MERDSFDLPSPRFLHDVYVFVALPLGEYRIVDRSADPKGNRNLPSFNVAPDSGAMVLVVRKLSLVVINSSEPDTLWHMMCEVGHTAFLLNFYPHNPIETAATAGQNLPMRVIPRTYTVGGARISTRSRKTTGQRELKCL